MLEETIKSVKTAEQKAEETVREVKRQAEEMIDQAKADAFEQKEQKISEVNKTVQEEMAKAVTAGEELLNISMIEVEKEIEILKADASQKENVAVELLIAELI